MFSYDFDEADDITLDGIIMKNGAAEKTSAKNQLQQHQSQEKITPEEASISSEKQEMTKKVVDNSSFTYDSPPYLHDEETALINKEAAPSSPSIEMKIVFPAGCSSIKKIFIVFILLACAFCLGSLPSREVHFMERKKECKKEQEAVIEIDHEATIVEIDQEATVAIISLKE